MAQEKVNSKKKDTKIGAVIILIISAIVFIPFGGEAVYQALIRRNKVPVFGKYKNTEIKYEEGSLFKNATANLARWYQNMGYDLNANANLSIFSEAFENTVKSMAYTEAVKQSGYTVPTAAVNRALVYYYTDETGKYSQRIHNQTNKATQESNRKNVEQSLVYYRYTDDLLGSTEQKIGSDSLYGLKRSAQEVSFISQMAANQHSFNYVAFDTTAFPQEEAVKWGIENTSKFIKYDLSAVSIDDEAAAEQLLKQIQANEVTFEDAVSEKSQNYYTDAEGKLTRSYGYQLELMLQDKADAAQITGLAKGALSAPLKTNRGYTLFRNDGAAQTPDFSDEELIEVVQAYLKSYEQGYIEDYYINIAKNFISSAAMGSFESASETFNVELVNTTAFPINYKDSELYSGTPTSFIALKNLSSDADALRTIFSLKLNEVSEPVVLGTNVLVFKCAGILTDDTTPNADNITSVLTTMDRRSSSSTLMASDKVENDVWTAYFDSFAD